MNGIEDEIERLDRVIIASEDWAKRYKKSPEYLAKLIKLEAKFGRVMRKYFKTLATERMDNYINWHSYHRNSVTAYNIDVTIDDEGLALEYDELYLVMHEPILAGMALGASYGEETYNIDLGLNTFNESILKATDKYTAKLVTNVSNTTRDRIKQSIKTSTSLHEDVETAKARLMAIVGDARRAELIARTETVSSYSKGITVFGEESGATHKYWELSSDPCSLCLENSGAGAVVLFSEDFPSGDSEPPAHPNCRCGYSLEHDYTEKL